MYFPNVESDRDLLDDVLNDVGQSWSRVRENGLSAQAVPAVENPDTLKRLGYLDKSRIRTADWYQQAIGKVDESEDLSPALALGSYRSELTYWLRIFRDHAVLMYCALPETHVDLKEDARVIVEACRRAAAKYELSYPETPVEDVDAPIDVTDAVILSNPSDVLYGKYNNDAEDVNVYGPSSPAFLAVQNINESLSTLIYEVNERISTEFVAFGLYKSFLAEMLSESVYFTMKIADQLPVYVQHEILFWGDHAKDHALLLRQLFDPALDKEDIAVAQREADIGTLLTTRQGVEGVCASVEEAPHSCVLPFGALTFLLQVSSASTASSVFNRLPGQDLMNDEEHRVEGTVPPLLAVHTILESMYGAVVLANIFDQGDIDKIKSRYNLDAVDSDLIQFAHVLRDFAVKSQ